MTITMELFLHKEWIITRQDGKRNNGKRMVFSTKLFEMTLSLTQEFI